MGTTMSKLASSDYECIFGTNYLNESVLGARIKLSRRVALPAYGSLRSTATLTAGSANAAGEYLHFNASCLAERSGVEMCAS
jgi:hypothetical protein